MINHAFDLQLEANSPAEFDLFAEELPDEAAYMPPNCAGTASTVGTVGGTLGCASCYGCYS